MIRKLHRPTLINTIIAGITANLLSFGVTLFCGFFEFKYVVMDAIVAFVLGIITILLSMKITSFQRRWKIILFIIICGLLVIGFLSIVLSYFYAIVFTPYYFYLNNESTEYSSYFIGFINVFEIITLYLFVLITSLDIGQTTLNCDYGGNE
ncbi:unnamed protein product [Schistosoma bovis]|nr:unnamed protein product [Schistosoma bovis]